VLASDIATHAITKAQAARYRLEDLKPVPEPLRRAWTVPDGQDATIAPEAQARCASATSTLGRMADGRRL
jgi:chemotaxis protein methyltransferase CheR